MKNCWPGGSAEPRRGRGLPASNLAFTRTAAVTCTAAFLLDRGRRKASGGLRSTGIARSGSEPQPKKKPNLPLTLEVNTKRAEPLSPALGFRFSGKIQFRLLLPTAASPAKPVPKRIMVVGSGTGADVLLYAMSDPPPIKEKVFPRSQGA